MSTDELNALIQRIRELRQAIGQGASPAEIQQAECALGVQLPRTYKHFLACCGWCALHAELVFGLGADCPPEYDLIRHTTYMRKDWCVPVPHPLVPIGGDLSGNEYCLEIDPRDNDPVDCPIVLWDHDSFPDQIPDIVAPGFGEWLQAKLEERLL